ncbi:MAG: LPS export ABC transporter periplasmic protein LptC [Thiomicrorhabdus sp.]|nr:LPS export ABC transporter periplasmic protein LptC [Thiomicrorhabdus sp.]
MRLSRLKILSLSLLLATIALWITDRQSQTTREVSDQKKPELAYSWQASNTTLWNLSPQQDAEQTILQAKSILYKENEKKSEYLQPHIERIDPDSYTQLTSEYGESFEDTILTFTNNVVVIQKTLHQSTTSPQPTTLNTERLNYNLQTNELTTDAKVLITQYNGQTSGTGLKANLKSSELELLSDVKGTYYPQKMQQPVQVKEP